MEYRVDDELRAICKEIQQEGKSLQLWAEIEASDWFQTPHYNGGFDATDMHFAFTVYVNNEQYCFAITLEEAVAIARGERDAIEITPSPWR